MSDEVLVYGFHCSVSLSLVKQKYPQLKDTISITFMTNLICGYVGFLLDLAQVFGMLVVKGTQNLR